MNGSQIRTFLSEIDNLVSNAQVAVNQDERVEYLQKALARACTYLKELNRRIPQVVNAVLAEGRFDPSGRALPLKDIVRDDPQLEVFREKKILLDFLYSSQDLLMQQMHFSPEKVKAIIQEVEQTYNQFMQEKIAINPLIAQFEKLQLFFCRPPWGGPGGSLVGPEPDRDGPSGVTKSRSETVCRYLTTATAVGAFLLPIIEKIIHSMSAESEPIAEDKKTYPHRVLALALTSGLAHHLESKQELKPVKVLEYA